MCDEREPLLEYLYDEVDAAGRQRVEAHLSTCERCRDELAGLRSVRADLLAWDVPEHDSVWKPFVPARPSWSWRDVPAWSLATAALVMLALGATGGIATSAWMSHRAPLVLSAQAPASPRLSPTQAVTAADLAALEQRVLDVTARRQLAQPTSTATRAGLTPTETDYDRLMPLIIDQQRLLKSFTTRMNDLTLRMDDLSARVNELSGARAATAPAQQGGR